MQLPTPLCVLIVALCFPGYARRQQRSRSHEKLHRRSAQWKLEGIHRKGNNRCHQHWYWRLRFGKNVWLLIVLFLLLISTRTCMSNNKCQCPHHLRDRWWWQRHWSLTRRKVWKSTSSPTLTELIWLRRWRKSILRRRYSSLHPRWDQRLVCSDRLCGTNTDVQDWTLRHKLEFLTPLCFRLSRHRRQSRMQHQRRTGSWSRRKM